ncbi:MAG: response regulator transcription factor [Caldilineales bacterium]|nr:response regulator transcription factor [Caldilineales bacterium]MCW5860398.1 response regulator transcription factor [Caldilineales bacterium]
MTDKTIRILIVDDHAVVRKGLAMVLRLESDFEVVGEAGNGQQALALARTQRPDLVLLDLILPGMDGVQIARALRALLPAVRILVLSGAELDERLSEIMAAGVDGYVLKEIEPEDLKQAIRAVAEGESYLHPAVARQVLRRLQARGQAPSPAAAPISPREHEVLRLMATEATYRQIGEQLTIGEETVRSHAKSILRKLDQPNRVQAVLAAVRLGLIELGE